LRTASHEQLDALTSQLGHMCGLAGVAMKRATQALLQADLTRPTNRSQGCDDDHHRMATYAYNQIDQARAELNAVSE
jgi:hypothetical protein